MATSTNTESKSDIHKELSRASVAAERNYKRRRNVVGVSAGIKYTKGLATDNYSSILFYVRKKIGEKRCKKALPTFVYGRFKNGKLNRKLKFKTDVIEVGAIRMACGSGSAISGRVGLTRQNGMIAIAFTNKARAESNYYVVSCAHVLGDVDGSNNVPAVLTSQCSPSSSSFGITIFNSKQQDHSLEFDIAVARVDSACLPLPDCQIFGTTQTLRAIVLSTQISLASKVRFALPPSRARLGVISSKGGSITVDYKRGTYEVRNAWLIKADRKIRGGDSGSLVYDDDRAVGVVFASSDSNEGWAWFHPLADALNYVRQQLPFELKVLANS